LIILPELFDINMPIEIRELVIKVNVVEAERNNQVLDKIQFNDLKTAIVKDCVNIVISKLSKLNDR